VGAWNSHKPGRNAQEKKTTEEGKKKALGTKREGDEKTSATRTMQRTARTLERAQNRRGGLGAPYVSRGGTRNYRKDSKDHNIKGRIGGRVRQKKVKTGDLQGERGEEKKESREDWERRTGEERGGGAHRGGG